MKTMSLQSQIVYGPVNSRRFGKSLGINLLPPNNRTCTFNCVYCQYKDGPGGDTFPGTSEIGAHIQSALEYLRDQKEKISWIMFSGNGEPTLHPEFAEIVDGVMALRDAYFPKVPVGILSNSSTCHKREIRSALSVLDTCFMKLDAGSIYMFHDVNRPITTFLWGDVIEGLSKLPRLCIQSMFVTGKVDNTNDRAVNDWIDAVECIKPREVQIYTISRTPQEEGIAPVSDELLKDISKKLFLKQTFVPWCTAMKPYKIKWSLAGVFLGIGAPLGAIFFKWVITGGGDLTWASREIAGHFYYYAYMTFLTPIAFGIFGVYLGTLHDTTGKQKKSLQDLMAFLEAQSMTDDITGLYNHRHLLEEIEKEIERSKRHNHSLSALMIDVDRFKDINDQYGHLAGDHILREVAAVIKKGIRKIDILGRYGGDEFVAILPEANMDAAKVVAERVLKNMQMHRFQTKKGYISLTVSVGVFSYEKLKSLDIAAFIEKIDEAMFKAKSLGKDRIFVSQ